MAMLYFFIALLLCLGYYIYIEASAPAKPGQKAKVQSENIPYVSNHQCLFFYYHMYGKDVDTLNIYLSSNGETTLQWTLKGEQGNKWQDGEVPIKPGGGDFKVEFSLLVTFYLLFLIFVDVYVSK